MGKKLEPKQMELYKFIDEILFSEWDPIGVSDMPEVRDEYYSCLPQVFSKTIRGESVEDIAKYLRDIEISYMGLSGANTNCKQIAEKIINKKQILGLS